MAENKIKFKGKTYELIESEFSEEMLNTSLEFQYKQLMHCIEVKDFVTLSNRINNGLIHGWIKEV